VGTQEHRNPLLRGEARNDPFNLAWCCHWCNTWESQRTPYATNAGGLYPGPDGVEADRWYSVGGPVCLVVWRPTDLADSGRGCLPSGGRASESANPLTLR
jgi:hypothetical protein